MSATALKEAAKGNDKVSTFKNFISKYTGDITNALPKHLKADRMIRLALTAFSTTPALQGCDPKSIIASIMTASQLGLEIGIDGQGYLVPYGKTCQFIPGWKGMVDLVNRSGKGTVYTGVIYSDQTFNYTDGARRDLVIDKPTELDDEKEITHVYAIGWVNGAAMPIIELWTIAKVLKHRDKYNKVGKAHYSYKNLEMYARKIPLLQVIKYMPKSIELQKAVELSDAQEAGNRAAIEGDFITVTPMEPEQPQGNVDQETGEIGDDQPEHGSLTFAQVADKINKADDLDVLDVAADLIGEISDQQQQNELKALYQSRKEAFTK